MKTADAMRARLSDDRLDWHLWNWEQWQRTRKSDYGTGYGSRASGGMGVASASEFDAMVATADSRCAAAVDAVLDSLSPVERCAVHAKHLEAVYRFERRTLDEMYASAREIIRRGLVLRGIQ